MLKYGSDKPDLRNPIDHRGRYGRVPTVRASRYSRVLIDKGAIVRAIPAPGAGCPTSQLLSTSMNELGPCRRSMEKPGLGYIISGEGGERRRPHRKVTWTPERMCGDCKAATGVSDGDAVFFVCLRPTGEAPPRNSPASPGNAFATGLMNCDLLIEGRLPVLLDRRLSRCSNCDDETGRNRLQPQSLFHAPGRSWMRIGE